MAHRFNFPRSCMRLGRRNFERLFLDELQQQDSKLSLERYCQHGGFPDLETAELEIASVAGDAEEAVIRVTCEFDETVPTSCGGISFPHPTLAKFTVALSANDERGEVEYLSVYDEPIL